MSPWAVAVFRPQHRHGPDLSDNMRRVSPRTFLVAVSGSLLLGCGGGTAGSAGGAVTTSVSGSMRLNDLSREQATQLCKDIEAANTATLEPTYCAATNHADAVLATDAFLQDNPTATDASLQTECSQLLTADEAIGCFAATSCDATTIASSSPTCTATVADIVNCLDENDAIIRKRLAVTPACDALTMSSLNAYGAPGGPFGTYNVVSMSASCSALVYCNGIITLSTPPPGS